MRNSADKLPPLALKQNRPRLGENALDHAASVIVTRMTASRDRLKNFAEVCDFLTILVAACTARGTCAACGGCGFARNAGAPAFDGFYWLQVTNFQVANFGLLNSAPNRPDYSHIRRSVVHCRYRIADRTQYSQRFSDRPTTL